ncbi:MAG: alanine--tRNA ligase-related protein, partial [Minisyncoccales bacterium]
SKIWPNVGLYSIAEHTRTLLVALTDGGLPSNTGGGYNLRAILRRALSFIDEFNWNIKLIDVVKWHAEELKNLFPELSDKLGEVSDILVHEEKKYNATKEKAKNVLVKYLEKGVSENTLLELYDSYGIGPDMVKSVAKEKGIKIHATKKKVPVPTENRKLIPKTKALYFDDYNLSEFESEVVYVDDDYVVLKESGFYPTSGGQLHDVGTLNGKEVIKVIKQDNVIVHVVPENNFILGQKVSGVIDFERRKQLTQLHTSAHIINAAARKVLGSHINQAGAKKVLDKASLDITHYKALNDDEVKKIEEEANKIVQNSVLIKKSFMSRREAEDKFGLNIYQGGAIPGNELRIVEISGIDVECCAGTHLNNTDEVGKISIIKTTKISDGIVRLEFVSGRAQEEIKNKAKNILSEVKSLLDVEAEMIPARVVELFKVWKKSKKAVKKKKPMPLTKLVSEEKFKGSETDILEISAKSLSTQVEHLPKTIKRFLDDIETFKKKAQNSE